MRTVATIGISAALALIGSVGGAHLLAQTNQPRGQWQMVSGAGGDGGAAWKFNVETGQSFYCYRQNCFASILLPNSKQ